MLVEKKYPLIKELPEKMLNLQLEAEEESTMAFELIKFIKSLLEEGGLLGILSYYLLDMSKRLGHPVVSEQDELPSSIGLDFRARLDSGRIYSGHLEAMQLP
ncbi:hypothetical protein Tco_0523409 [Tanacetum coccineum]